MITVGSLLLFDRQVRVDATLSGFDATFVVPAGEWELAEYKLDAGSWTAFASGTLSLTGLSAGAHTILIRPLEYTDTTNYYELNWTVSAGGDGFAASQVYGGIGV